MTRRTTPLKTADQLQREIAYFAAQLQRTTSRDRIARAHAAIRLRERQLADVRRATLPRGTSDSVGPVGLSDPVEP